MDGMELASLEVNQTKTNIRKPRDIQTIAIGIHIVYRS